MTEIILNTVVTIAAFAAMEGVAWFTHKYIMHGFLWSLHRSHHAGSTDSHLERNDLFFLFFAIPGILGLLAGIRNDFNWFFFAGLGITLYGMTYFFVHDVLIHRRLPVFRNIRKVYLLALRRAHKIHHKSTVKYGGSCFGMLLVPFRYYRTIKKQDG